MSGNDENTARNFTPVSPERRIKEINEIDHDVSRLLSCASKAIALLPNEDYKEPNPKLEDVKEQFQELCSEYYAMLSSIEVHSRRQIYALEEAGLITKGTKQDADRATSMNEDQTNKRAGGGPLDSSWLNARARDSVGLGLKRDALDQAKEFLRKSGVEVDGRKIDEMQIDTGDG